MITFDATIADIKNVDANHLFGHLVALKLIDSLQSDQKLALQGKTKQALTLLNLTIDGLNLIQKSISTIVYQMIISDLTYLKQTLNP